MKINFNPQTFSAKIKDTDAARKLQEHFDYEINENVPLKNFDRFRISVDCILPNDSDEVTFHVVEQESYNNDDIHITGTISRKGRTKEFSLITPSYRGVPHMHRNIIQVMKKVIKKL